MGFNAVAAKETLFAQIPANFVDPLTGVRPRGEDDLTALIALFHQMERFSWERVNLYLPSHERSGRIASDLFGSGGALVSQYPLFWEHDGQRDTWGQMKADLLFVSISSKTLALIEAKVASGFTGTGADPHTGQLARYADFLLQSKIPNRLLVVLIGREFLDANWYCSELRQTLSCDSRDGRIEGYVILWEEIFAALL